MTVSAYILIQADLGRASEIMRAIRQLDGIDEAHDVTGPYDLIAKATAASIDDLGRLVVGDVQRVEGITRTVTCPIVHLEER